MKYKRPLSSEHVIREVELKSLVEKESEKVQKI